MKVEIDYNGGTNPVFVGYATPGALTSDPIWRILKVTYDINNNPTAVLWADGNTFFDNIWDNRAGLSYS